MRSVMFSIVFIGFIITGMYTVIMGVFMVVQANASEHWIETQGTITVSEISSHTRYDDDNRKHTSYSADIEYSYEVNEQQYFCSRISYFYSSSSLRQNAQKVCDTYPVGATVSVFYNPDNPSEAVLEQGSSWVVVIYPLVGLLFLSIGSVGMYYVVKKYMHGESL